MSVILGICSKGNHCLEESFFRKMIEPLKAIRFDRWDVWENKDVFLGCGHQYSTPESPAEVLPRWDEEAGLSITADAIIDNRRELLGLFSIPKELQAKTTDSELILLAYRKWGEDCPKYLVGDFAFAIRDKSRGELFCARDHAGKRTLYYYESGEFLAFSTLLKPLLSLLNKVELNERWLADFLAMELNIHETECSETVYRRIFQLPPGCWLRLKSGSLVKKRYWDPLQEAKPLLLPTDEEYEEAFREVFFEAVACRLRSSGEVGIKMSGGIDSGAIACVAAAMLAEKNKKLYSFSSVPLEGFDEKPRKNHLFDESENIRAIVDFSGNIEAELLPSEGKHPLSDVEQIVDMLEQPYKTYQNMFWLQNIMEQAARKGCKVLLSGSYGNFTISYGDFNSYAKSLFKKGKIFSLWREILALSQAAQVPAAKITRGVLAYILPYQLKDCLKALRSPCWDQFSRSVANPQLLEKWDVKSRFRVLGLNQRSPRTYDDEAFKKQRVNPVYFSHIAAIEGKQAVYSGVVLRDPTRDKRVLEFCLSLPGSQFVRNGEDRYLIRRAMAGRMPDKIRLGHVVGLQGADWLYRMRPYWGEVLAELEAITKDEAMDKYLDLEKMKKELGAAKEGAEKTNRFSAQKIFTAIIFYRFMQWHKKNSPSNFGE